MRINSHHESGADANSKFGAALSKLPLKAAKIACSTLQQVYVLKSAVKIHAGSGRVDSDRADDLAVTPENRDCYRN